MADHVGWKLSCDLFQNIRQCNIIKMMDPGGWIFAGACLNGNRSLYILPLKINQSATKTAAALYIHRSTLLYRIEKIEAALKSDLTDPDELLYLMLSFYLMDQEEKSKK